MTLAHAQRFGAYGEESGSFKFPHDVLSLMGTAVVVSDTWNGRLQVLSMDAKSGAMSVLDVFNFSSGMEPCGMTMFDGRIYVAIQGFGQTKFHQRE